MFISQQLILVDRVKNKANIFLISLALFCSDRKDKIDEMAIDKR
jgi:hypothetical protein